MPNDASARMETARRAMTEVLLQVQEVSKSQTREPQTLDELQPNLVFQKSEKPAKPHAAISSGKKPS